MAVHPVADFGIRTYVALPITEHGTARNEIRNLGIEYQTRCRERIFHPTVEDPSIIVSSFYAPNIERVREIARKIQEVVTREFERFVISRTDAIPYDLENCHPSPSAESRDYAVLHVRDSSPYPGQGPQSRFERIVQIIRQNGGEMLDHASLFDRSPLCGAAAADPLNIPFVLLGDIQPCRSRAEPGSYPTRGIFWSEDRSKYWPPNGANPGQPAPKINSIEVDPKRLLFFTKEGRPERFHNLDLRNPMSFPVEEPHREVALVVPPARVVAVEAPRTAASHEQDEAVNRLLDTAQETRRQLNDLRITHAHLIREGRDGTQVQTDIDALRRRLSATVAEMNEALNPRETRRRVGAEAAPTTAPVATEVRQEYLLGEDFRRDVTVLLEVTNRQLGGRSPLLQIRDHVDSMFRRPFRSRDEAVDCVNRAYFAIRGLNVVPSELVTCIGRKLSAMTEEGMV